VNKQTALFKLAKKHHCLLDPWKYFLVAFSLALIARIVFSVCLCFELYTQDDRIQQFEDMRERIYQLQYSIDHCLHHGRN